MRQSSFATFIWAVTFLFAAGLAPAAERTAGSATPAHASSGIGDDDPLATLSGEYTLQIVFATQGSGEYLADVRLQIADAKGGTLLESESPGPFFFVRLPAGTYRISADFNGTPLQKSVVLTGRGLKTLYFYWPRETIETDKGRL